MLYFLDIRDKQTDKFVQAVVKFDTLNTPDSKRQRTDHAKAHPPCLDQIPPSLLPPQPFSRLLTLSDSNDFQEVMYELRPGDDILVVGDWEQTPNNPNNPISPNNSSNPSESKGNDLSSSTSSSTHPSPPRTAHAQLEVSHVQILTRWIDLHGSLSAFIPLPLPHHSHPADNNHENPAPPLIDVKKKGRLGMCKFWISSHQCHKGLNCPYDHPTGLSRVYISRRLCKHTKGG